MKRVTILYTFASFITFFGRESLLFAEVFHNVTDALSRTFEGVQRYCTYPEDKRVEDPSEIICKSDPASKHEIAQRSLRAYYKFEKAYKDLLRAVPRNLRAGLPEGLKNWTIADGKLPEGFNKELVKERLARAKINLKRSSIWSGHCRLVYGEDNTESCKKPVAEDFRELNDEIEFYPKDTQSSDQCESLISQINAEVDVIQRTILREELGRKCVNWCANLTEKEKSFLCGEVVQNIEENMRIHACDGWWAAKGSQNQMSEGQVCERLTLAGMNPLSSFELEAKKLTGAFATITESELIEQGGVASDARRVSRAANPFRSSWRRYAELLRMEALAGYLDASCDIMGMPFSAPPKCMDYENGFENFQCSDEQHRDPDATDRKRIVKNARRLESLYGIRRKLKSELDAEIQGCIESKFIEIRKHGGQGVPESSLRQSFNFQCDRDHRPRFQSDLNDIENGIRQLSLSEPILFAKADSSKSLFNQEKRFFDGFTKFSKINLDKEESEKDFKRAYDGSTTDTYIKLYESMDDVCNSEKLPLRDLLQMKHLTSAVQKRWPMYKGIERCLGNPDPKGTGANLGAGTALLCLAGSIGPQFFVVGGLCAGLFLGDSISTAAEQEELLGFMRRSTQAKGKVSSYEDIDRVKENLESAKLDLLIGVFLLPLEFTGARAGFRALRKSFSKIGNVKDRLFLTTKLDREVKGILNGKFSDEIKSKRLEELIKRYENPQGIISFHHLKTKYPNVSDDNLKYFVKRYPCLK